MVTAVSSPFTATTTTSSYGAAPISSDPTQDRFLKLLVAQMKNQDPLNPLDNAAVTSQMAQINTVQGISQLNTSMSALLVQFQGAQAASLSGHQVLVAGNNLTLSNAGGTPSAQGGFDLAQDADKVVVDIKDANGQLVREINLGAQSAGAGSFQWDGSIDGGNAAPGTYTIDVKASSGSSPVSVGALTAARVTGSTTTATGVRLTLEGQGTHPYSDVRMVL